MAFVDVTIEMAAVFHTIDPIFLQEIQWNEPCYTELISLLLELGSYHMSIYGK